VTVRFVATVETSLGAAEAFAYLSDLGNARNWDPAVERVRRLGGAGVGEGTAFAVRVGLVGGVHELTYRVVEWDPPHAVTFLAESAELTSRNRLTFERLSTSTQMTYSAELGLRGPARASELVSRVAFARAGERAIAGLQRVLAPAVPETLAPLAARTLSGEERAFPHDLEHPLNLLVIGFGREQRRAVEEWAPWLDELRRIGAPELAVYELAVFSARYSPLRRSIDESLAQAVGDPSERARILTLYTDLDRVAWALGLADAATIALILVDRSGRVLACERGRFDELKARRLIGGHAQRSLPMAPVPSPAA
jgi:hypothetical protein